MKILTKTALVIASMGLAVSAIAAKPDPLANTKWIIKDDKTNDNKAVVKIIEKDGELSGTIVEVLSPELKNGCKTCTGRYKNKSISDAIVFTGLKPKGDGEYVDGFMTNIDNGKTYKLKASLDGNELKMQGDFFGIFLLGDTQIWAKQ